MTRKRKHEDDYSNNHKTILWRHWNDTLDETRRSDYLARKRLRVATSRAIQTLKATPEFLAMSDKDQQHLIKLKEAEIRDL